MRVALVAHGQHPIADPYAGGLEVFTAQLVRGLRERGHDVLLYAAEGTDPDLADELVTFPLSPLHAGRANLAPFDAQLPDAVDQPETRAYLDVVRDLVARGRDVDVVANHTLQPTVLACSAAFDAPLVTTLHTPPLRPLVAAARLTDHRARFVAVSRPTADAWRGLPRPAVVIENGVDTVRFRPGPGGTRALWSGRMTVEKGPDLAIEAARRAGIGLDLYGPVSDAAWFAEHVEPRLGDGVAYRGLVGHDELAERVRHAAIVLVTPRWEEPFGLVAAEAMVSGTPVVSLARGALPDVVRGGGVVVPPGRGTAGLATAIGQALALDRDEVAAAGLRRYSPDRMVDAYARCYSEASSHPSSVRRTSPSSAKAASQPSIGHTPQRA